MGQHTAEFTTHLLPQVLVRATAAGRDRTQEDPLLFLYPCVLHIIPCVPQDVTISGVLGGIRGYTPYTNLPGTQPGF